MRALSGRSARRRTRTFLVEGPQAVREAVAAHCDETRAARAGASGTAAPGGTGADGARTGRARDTRTDGTRGPGGARERTGGPGGRGPAGLVRALYATPEALDREDSLFHRARACGIRPVPVTDRVLAAMADTVTPQGMLAVCAVREVSLDEVLATGPLLVAVLDRVRDPGNAGTVLRAADAAGADAVVLTSSSVDVHNPKCVRSTAGSLFHLPVVTGADLPGAVRALRRAGLRVHATAGNGPVDLDDLLDDPAAPCGLGAPTAWVFGNEARGLDEGDLALADDAVRVPVHGRAESLNLAMAATVCLYASARAQRGVRGSR